MYTTLISAAQLLTLTQSAQPYQVLDCTFDLTQPELGRKSWSTWSLDASRPVER